MDGTGKLAVQTTEVPANPLTNRLRGPPCPQILGPERAWHRGCCEGSRQMQTAGQGIRGARRLHKQKARAVRYGKVTSLYQPTRVAEWKH
eukprot:1160894-Pelagomonas_calceolata.AAC.24